MSIPIYSCFIHFLSIMDIQYKNQNGEWRRIETYPTNMVGATEVPEEITESGKLVFSFPKKEVTELQIYVKQPYWFKHDNKRVFMYGFQDIVVEYREYSQDTAEFVTKFSLEGTDRRFSQVAFRGLLLFTFLKPLSLIEYNSII
ncbi:hypothetical protein [Priestia aryabhattai]|uniref:hypothetical protein n=1 Tax=Priestia aryabhattai TaxID=412384 RepID=UPI0021AEE7BA|nr:hypothetical protein [Priestia aryabhattai]